MILFEERGREERSFEVLAGRGGCGQNVMVPLKFLSLKNGGGGAQGNIVLILTFV